MEAGAQWGHTLTPLCFLSLALRVSQLCVSSPQVWRRSLINLLKAHAEPEAAATGLPEADTQVS